MSFDVAQIRAANQLTHLSLFSGIGGLDLAAEWAGFKTVAFVERDKYCQRVLAKHWPGVPIFDDVAAVGHAEIVQCYGGEYNFRGAQEHGQAIPESGNPNSAVSCISGGFPCQPHSVAGKRKASADERDLWHEFSRIIGEVRPRWVIAENVPGLFTSEHGRFFERILGDLASMGFDAGWCCYGADDVGALHRRDRVFIVAHADDRKGTRLGQYGGQVLSKQETKRPSCGGGFMADTGSNGREWQCALGVGESSGRDNEIWKTVTRGIGASDTSGSWWSVEPDVGRVAHGIPKRVDRLRALGNAVVPQQAYPIFKAIADIERSHVI